MIILGSILAYLFTRPLPVPKVSNYVQITHDGEQKSLVGTDGSRLYFNLGSATSPAIARGTAGLKPRPSREPVLGGGP